VEQNLIQLVDISKTFNNEVVLHNINLNVKKNEFVTILGPSGCGKTTTLRIIGGFETATTGKLLFHGEDIGSKPPHLRNVNTVFQSYALFPHMNVERNIGYSLRLQKAKK